MSFFRENYAPVCSSIVTEIDGTINSNFDYTIKPYACTDVDDSLDGTKLSYNAYTISDPSSPQLPQWLTFVANQIRFYGTPITVGEFFVVVNATDGHAKSYPTAVLNYKFSVIRIENQPPRQIKEIEPLTVSTIDMTGWKVGSGDVQASYFVPADYFTDDDGDNMTISFASIPRWLTIVPNNLVVIPGDKTKNFIFSALPMPTDTDVFDSRKGEMYLNVSDSKAPLFIRYEYIVTGNSILTWVLTYGSMAMGIFGTIGGFYAYRNQMHNTFAWDRYRVKPTQFGRTVDTLYLFAVKSDSISSEGLASQHDIDTPVIARWSALMPKERDAVGDAYFRHRVLSDMLDNGVAHSKRKEIEDTVVLMVHQLPDHTRLQKAKAKVLNSIPKIFNGIFCKMLGRFGVKMSPNYWAIFEPIIGGTPSWLQYNQRTKVLRVVDIGEDDYTPFNTPIVLRFVNKQARIIEELAFIVRDEASFAEVFPDIAPAYDIEGGSISITGTAKSAHMQLPGFIPSITTTAGSSFVHRTRPIIRNSFAMPTFLTSATDEQRTPLLASSRALPSPQLLQIEEMGQQLQSPVRAATSSPDHTVVMAIPEMRYDNPILNHKSITDIIKQAKAIGGSGLAATLIDICGANEALAVQIIRAFEDNGVEPTLRLIDGVRIASDRASDRTSADRAASDGIVAGSKSALVQADEPAYELAHELACEPASGGDAALTPVSGALIPFGAIPVPDQAQQLPLALMAGAEQEAGAQFAVENLIRLMQPALYKASLVLKGADTAIDAIRCYQQPTQEHAQALAVDALHLYAMWAGYSVVSAATSAVLVAHTYNEAGFDAAAKQAAMAAAYMALPVLAFGASPAAGIGFTAAMTCYTAYQAGANGYMLYRENFWAENFSSDLMQEEQLFVAGDMADGVVRSFDQGTLIESSNDFWSFRLYDPSCRN